MKLTPEEKAAIRKLKALAKTWPPSLYLFSGGGSLWVMRRKEGEGHAMDASGSADHEAAIVRIDIPNDGGDW